MQDTNDIPKSGIQAIARAGKVLRALEAAPEGLTLGELADEVQLAKSTVHRLVAALAAEELVSAPPGARIRLGGGLARMGAATQQALRHDIRPVLEALRAQVNETVDLSRLDGNVARFVDQVQAGHRLSAVSAVGSAFPLHCTANGKALLSAMTDEQVIALLPPQLERFTAATITDRDALLAELTEVRAGGVAFDHEEHTDGISAVGAVINDAAGPVAALSVPVPTARFAGQESRYAQALLLAAAEATRRLS